MRRRLRFFTCVLVFLLQIFAFSESRGQCAMCTLNAENSVQNGNTEGKGLNTGILYLLAAPYLAIAAVGFVWYRKYRRKNVALNIKEKPLNLN